MTDSKSIEPHHLPANIYPKNSENKKMKKFSTLTEAKHYAANQAEHDFVTDCLRATQGHIRDAAKMAGIDTSNFHKIMKKHGINFMNFKNWK